MASEQNKTSHRARSSDESPPEDYLEKKLKMRTASDVISRLLWDDSLQRDFFTVGYLDRFKGLVEKPFSALNWSDPSIVDNYTLALPKHRIQYFKYKNKKVWDKTIRRDIVFGSTGEQMNIYDFMKEVDDQECNFFDENFFGDISYGYDSDNDVGDPKYVYSAGTYDASDRPNYFIAARITDEEIVEKLKRIASSIKEKEPILEECCMTEYEYHITLSILKLESIEQIVDVTEVLKSLQSLQLLEPKIQLEKLDVFKHRVLHVCVKPHEEFLKLRENLVKRLDEKKINITDRFAFVPHVTILKLSRPVQRAMHTQFLDPSLYISFEDDHFGTQTIRELHLCEMKDVRRDDGFYRTAAEVDVTGSSN